MGAITKAEPIYDIIEVNGMPKFIYIIAIFYIALDY